MPYTCYCTVYLVFCQKSKSVDNEKPNKTIAPDIGHSNVGGDDDDDADADEDDAADNDRETT